MHSSDFHYTDPYVKDAKEELFTIHHDGDYSGDVKIVTARQPEEMTWDGKTTWTFDIPFKVLAQLVADKIRSDRISDLEQAKAEELFGIRGELR